MTLLSYNKLCELAAQNVITDVKHEQINSASIDITLGDTLLLEHFNPHREGGVISLKRKEKIHTKPFVFNDDEDVFYLRPGQFILAQSKQMFNLPNNISAEYKLKSSMARIGLEHLNAGWCDAGWNGSVLTLELKNMNEMHTIELNRGVGIGQVVFFEHEPVPDDRSYAVRGRYNGDATVTGAKAE